MRAARWNRTVLGVAAVIEAVTGLVMILFPHALVRLLFGADMAGTGSIIDRVAGIALISLGLGCWMGRQEENGGWALAAMLIYNSLVTIYLTLVGFGTEFVGILLWPAAALHATLTALLAYPLIEPR
jgi:hypothetical protein